MSGTEVVPLPRCPLRVCLSQASAPPGLASRPSENGRRSPSNSSLSEGKADPVTCSAGEGVGGVSVGAALRRGLLAPAPTWPAEADTSEPWELGLLAAGASPPPSSQPGADGSVCPSSTLSSVCSRLGVGVRKGMTNSAILPSSQGCVQVRGWSCCLSAQGTSSGHPDLAP